MSVCLYVRYLLLNDWTDSKKNLHTYSSHPCGCFKKKFVQIGAKNFFFDFFRFSKIFEKFHENTDFFTRFFFGLKNISATFWVTKNGFCNFLAGEAGLSRVDKKIVCITAHTVLTYLAGSARRTELRMREKGASSIIHTASEVSISSSIIHRASEVSISNSIIHTARPWGVRMRASEFCHTYREARRTELRMWVKVRKSSPEP